MFDWNDAPDTRDTRPDLRALLRHHVTGAIERGEATAIEAVSRCACGQTMIGTRETCDGCDTAAPVPPATPERLFEPAPAPMPGQIMGRWDPYQ